MKNNDDVYFICPHCGSQVKASAKACPHCGSDENTGWKDGAAYADEELPDYDEILENEFGEDSRGKKKKAHGMGIVGTIAAIIVALAFMAAMVLH